MIHYLEKDINMKTQNKLYGKNEEIPINVISKENTKVEEITPQDENDKLLKDIKDVLGNNKVTNNTYFTTGKGLFDLLLDESIFMPSKIILLQPKKLEKLYLKELESILFSSKKELDVDKLLPLIVLFSHINKNNYPIRIVTSNYKKLLPIICKTLNYFLNKNYKIICSIYESFNSIKDTEEERNKTP